MQAPGSHGNTKHSIKQVTANMSKKLSKKQRVRRAHVKQVRLDKLVRAQWGMKDLLEIFGLGIAHRLRHPHRHAEMGQNYFSNHFHAGARNPAGSKLLRSFVRANGARSASYERDYKALTGRRHNHVNLGEDESAEAAA
jgi:hypothetical protein